MKKMLFLSLSLFFWFSSFGMQTGQIGSPGRPQKNRLSSSEESIINSHEKGGSLAILDRFERVFDRLEGVSDLVTSLQERVQFLQDKLTVLHKMEQSNLSMFESIVQRLEDLEFLQRNQDVSL